MNNKNMQQIDDILDRLDLNKVQSDIKDELTTTISESIDDIKAQLRENMKSTVLTLLGFNPSSGSSLPSIDHCNGRSGNSIIGNEMRFAMEPLAIDIVKGMVESCITDNKHEWIGEVATQKMADVAKKEFQRSIDSQMRSYVAVVKKEAGETANEIVPILFELISGKTKSEIQQELVIAIISGTEPEFSLKEITPEIIEDAIKRVGKK